MASRMENVREQTMSRGAILFAFNSPKFDYYSMAEFTAKRINHFLNIPVTIVTDESSLPDNPNYNFDNIPLIVPEININKICKCIWVAT